ncbi:MAG: hypothetical protein OXC03_08215 [Flavobacteriaceae bacterium]|nr:hypothetical protein [Flavobacteriaceae bacterium]
MEVKDDDNNWRIILVSEAKHQGKDIDNIKKGNLVGPKKKESRLNAGWKCNRKVS